MKKIVKIYDLSKIAINFELVKKLYLKKQNIL